MLVSYVMGKVVLDKNAIRLGNLVDVDLNFARGMIDFIIVKVGLTKKIAVPVSNIETTGDKVILNVSKEELGKTPAPAR
jgi:sporulation protein YlmC with PRC-barrel domain